MLQTFLQDHNEKNQIKKSLYKALHAHGPTSKVALREAFRVPNATLTRMLDSLMDSEIIRQCGLEKSSGGRPSKLYDINASAGAVIGIEIARTDVHILLMNIGFQIHTKVEFPLTIDDTPTVTINKIVNKVGALITSHQINNLIAIGVGTVGPIDRKNGIILYPEAFLATGWRQVEIVSLLKKEFHVPVVLENGANTAALAEYHQQGTKDESILYCIGGYGIRCGFMQNGQLLHHSQGDASSFGHMIVQAGGRTCSCGHKGCLQAYASFGSMLKQMKKQGLPAVMNELLYGNDLRIKQIRKESAEYFGIGLANIANVLHPDTIVLHGKMIYHHEAYFREIVRSAEVHSFQEVHIRKGSLGEIAGSVGAAMHAFHQFF